MRSSTSVAQAVAAVLSGCAFVSAAPVWGAQSDSGQVIEEVIVTVERIEQNLQSYEGTAVVTPRLPHLSDLSEPNSCCSMRNSFATAFPNRRRH